MAGARVRSSRPSTTTTMLHHRLRATGMWMKAERRVCLPFGWKTIRFSYADLAGHSSFLLLAISFGLNDILELRGVALAAGASMAVFNYWHPNGKVLWLPFRWNMLFIGVNLLQIIHILYERKQAETISSEAQLLYDEVFLPTGLSRVAFHKLEKAGEWKTFPTGERLTREDTFNANVLLISEGHALVHLRGQPVYELKLHNFVGEMGLHVGLHSANPTKSTATVTTTRPTRCLVWKRGQLIDLLEDNPDIASAVLAATSTDLLRKLSRPAAHQTEPETRSRLTSDWYKSITRSILQDIDTISDHDKNILARFRRLHHITEAEHAAVVAATGWTLSEFEEGKRQEMYVSDPHVGATLLSRWVSDMVDIRPEQPEAGETPDDSL